MKLGAKLTLITTAVTAAAALIGTVLAAGFVKQNTEEQIISAGIEDFCMFYNDFSNIAFHTDPETMEGQNVLRYQFYQTSGFKEFILEQGDSIFSNNTGIDAAGVLDAKGYATQTAGRFEEPIRYAICKVGGQDYLLISAGINILERSLVLSFARNITQTMNAVRELAAKCAVAGAGVLIMATAVVWALTRRSLKPIGTLEKGASEIAAGSYERRIFVKGHDEIAALAEKFNGMAEAISEKVCQLSDTAERQRIFINGLSHELKTPISSIMARAETLLMRNISQEDKRRSLERIYDQSAWLERLAGKLMTLTMLDGNIEMRQASVTGLFESVEATVTDALRESGIRLEMNCEMDSLAMDVDLMRSALVNLVENARRASPKAAVIELTAKNGCIAVKDYGKGIPPDEISRVMEPFYMVDRSRSKKNGGSGLGLALVKRIAEAHHARLEIESGLGIGTTVRICFLNDDN